MTDEQKQIVFETLRLLCANASAQMESEGMGELDFGRKAIDEFDRLGRVYDKFLRQLS